MTSPLNIAIVYDFDGTLSPGNMQESRFIPAVGLTKDQFWQMVRDHAACHQADPTLAYMQVMLETARSNGISVTRQDLATSANSIRFFPGLPGWFPRINAYARAQAARVSHYVVSSGNAEIIEATRIAPFFDQVFGSRFAYDQHGNAVWPAEAINFTTKTQYLFRINKNAVRPGQRDDVNLYVPQEDRPFPFENIVYLGDGETDIPCFSLVESKGGLAVAVYAPDRRDGAMTYLRQNRVNAVTQADYRPCSVLDRVIKRFIDHAAARHRFRLTLESTRGDQPPPLSNPGGIRK